GTGDLTDIDYSDSTQDIGFTYNRLGQQQTVTDALGTRTFSYNDSKLMPETETITGLYSKVVTRTYDTADVPGRPTGFNIGADYSITYGYEPDTGRFGSVSWNSDASAHTAAYTYEPDSDLLHDLTVGDRFKTTYRYEPERNLRTQVKNEFDSQTVSVYDYLYNEQGLRTSLETGGSAFSGGTVAPDVKPAAYTANSLNQYTDIITTMNPGQYIPGQDIIPAEYIMTNPGYDDDGNLTGISDDPGTLRYSYNAENRLIAAAPELPMQGDRKVEFVYDYMGRRVKKTVFMWNGSWTQETEKLFVYDGWNMICEITTESGQSATEKYYVWGLDLSQSLQGAGGIGGLIAALDKQTGIVYYYLYDANGNVGQLVNAADGTIAAHYEYDPFGNL
ncbi:MAG: hypothetical protein GY820_28855, partial [Gammaproteobacteria bacterium]|nr:hypothetical protein [Gammaproteobacteria bacterium]